MAADQTTLSDHTNPDALDALRPSFCLADWVARHILPALYKGLTARRLQITAFVSFALLIAGLFGASFLKPWYNWDMTAYFAVSLQDLDPTLTNAQLHEQSFALVKALTPEEDFTNLTQVGEYRKHMLTNADDFVSMLPMYEVKFLYVAAGTWLSKFIGLWHAYYLMSAVSFAALGGILLFWMTKGGFLQAMPIAAAAVLMMDSFRLSLFVTPDIPAAFFVVWGCERIVSRRPWVGNALLLVGLGLRPDTLLLIFALLLSALVFRRDILPALVGFVLGFIAYKIASSGSHHPGWWAHFHFACVEIQNTMTGFAPDFSIANYAKGLLRGVAIGLRDHDWQLITVATLMGWATLIRSGKGLNRVGNQMMLTCILALGGKFIVFPMPDDRFYLAIVLVMVMVLLQAWKPDFSVTNATKRT